VHATSLYTSGTIAAAAAALGLGLTCSCGPQSTAAHLKFERVSDSILRLCSVCSLQEFLHSKLLQLDTPTRAAAGAVLACADITILLTRPAQHARQLKPRRRSK